MTHHTSPRHAVRLGRLFSLAAALGLAIQPAFATSFSIPTGTNNTARTLGPASGETGSVSAGAALSVSGGTAAVTVTGNNASITNGGTIAQTGTGRTIDANTAGITLTITNSGTISSAGGNETIRLAQTATLLLTNNLGAIITSAAADAIRPGNNSIINNFGTISANPPNVASPAGSDGIDLRTERTGITINNSGTISGRHGIATDGANVGPSSVTVNNNAGGVIFALNGSGLNVDANPSLASAVNVTANVTNAFGATIKGGAMSASTEADGDGIDVDGVLTLNNAGDILGLGAKGGSNNAEGIAAGGGTIVNQATGRIIGSSLPADAPHGDATRAGNGILIDDSNGSNAVAATAITNAGLIQGKTGFGVKLIGTFNDTIDNLAGGVIRGGKAASAASYAAVVDTGGGNDLVTNAGSILSDGGAAATAITLGAGNDQLTHTGAGAVVTGAMDGGSGTDSLGFNLGSGGAFTQNGAVTNFEHVEIASGRVQLSGALSLGADSNTLAVQSAGILDLAGNSLTLGQGSATVDGTLKFLLNSSASHGQLFFDAANLGGLTLTGDSVLDLDLGYSPLVGDQFTLVDFQGASSWLSGTFAGLAEGTEFYQEGYKFQISYLGNEGHDIVLTRAVPDAGATLGFLAAGLGLLALARRRHAGPDFGR